MNQYTITIHVETPDNSHWGEDVAGHIARTQHIKGMDLEFINDNEKVILITVKEIQ